MYKFVPMLFAQRYKIGSGGWTIKLKKQFGNFRRVLKMTSERTELFFVSGVKRGIICKEREYGIIQRIVGILSKQNSIFEPGREDKNGRRKTKIILYGAN
jgi:hypothetical protein